MQLDVRVLELLSSKLCHDLISPVSAINNGVELIEDIGGSVVDEAMKIIGDSGQIASRRLRLYRLAYGRAGSEDNVNLKEARQILEAYFTGGKIVFSWPDDLACEVLSSVKGATKVLINTLLLGEEVLAYGGAISLKPLDGDDRQGVAIDVSGRSAQLSESFKAALEGTVPVEELTPRTIHAYVTGKFAECFGVKIPHTQPEDGHLEFSLLLTAPEYDGHASA